ncbi:SusC/RagA family TonB-linked outer membrane protein [Niabella ginsengisoli]|uniref:TonB-dependent receptor n=1 Tax=Niabella ginsengisoli TaxID=522298 RepID=A0ABS9SHI7_9BACT|nr:TonB-dependent receptor [Niabella ginsengisoli]MCH5597795.1 TonB-dependent receptor [Niabella ginsengisoli]
MSYDQFKDRSFANVAQSLEGAIAGVNISTAQGAPGFGPTIKIRGTSSITAGTTPLYVVDGMALENFDLNLINPQDIQSVEILKDAASSAIYGSRGASGVILVTTKLGKAGKPSVNVTYEHGISKVTRKVDMMDAQQWIQYYIDAKNNSWIALDPVNNKATDDNATRTARSGSAARNYLIPPDFISDPGQFGAGTDWQDVMFRTAHTNNLLLSLSGGTDKTSYLFSAGYLDQDAVLIGNFYKRLSLRTNIRQKISDKVTAGLNLSFIGAHDRTDGTTGKSDVVSLGIQSDPIFPEYNENGNLGYLDPNSVWNRFTGYEVQLWNPHSLIDYADKLNKNYNTLANLYLEYQPIKDLTLKGTLNGNLNNINYSSYWTSGQGYGYSFVLPASGSVRNFTAFNWLSELIATYNKTIGDHNFGLVAGYSAQKQRYDSTSLNGSEYPNDLVKTINAAGVVTKGPWNGSSEWSLLSMLGRLSYGYKNKYFFNATIRRDGSSRFGPNSKWGLFPSASAAWVISDENFMQNQEFVNNLKLRVSYGKTGNNLIPNYGSVPLLGSSRYSNGTGALNGLGVISLGNSDLEWEKTDQYNIGIDLAMLNNRINITLDAYKSVTKDMLLNVPVPAYTGFVTQLTNIGSMQNVGAEFMISSKNIVSDFKWNTDFNISFNRNKVLKLGGNNAPIEIDEWGYFVTEVGQPLANYKGYIFDGVYNNQAQADASAHYAGAAPGDPIIRDVNNDGAITSADRTILGNSQPDFSAGIVNTVSYKGVEFSFMFQGVFGNEIWNQQTRFSKFWNASRNSYAISNDYWRSEQDPGNGQIFKPYAIYPATTQGKAAYIQGYSNYWMEDGTFVRLKNIRLSYTIPAKITARTPFRNARVYVNAENVYVWSDYVGFDPQNSTYSVGANTVAALPGQNGGNVSNPPGLMLGADYGAYPIPTTVTFGVKMDF